MFLIVANQSRNRCYWALSVGGLAVLFVGLLLWGPRRITGSYAQTASGTPRSNIALAVIDGYDPGYVFFKGRGVAVGHVEGSSGDYLPNRRAPVFQGLELTARSGPGKVNPHADSTAKVIYGSKGLASGVKDVYFYTTSHWLGSGVLQAGTDRSPVTDGRRVFTHSWIGNAGLRAANILRRVDYLIDAHNVVMVVGVNNGADSPVPALLASAYNTIAVGKANGQSSGGYTVFEGAGRCKPDVVAARSTTSGATPAVAASAARLIEAADHLGMASASRPEVVKAILMAGARKPTGWSQNPGKPLDEHLGVGVERFSYSYAILRAGPVGPDQVAGEYGWHFRQMGGGSVCDYRFDFFKPMGEVSVVLVWHRRVDGRQTNELLSGASKWLDQPRLADFDLRWIVEHEDGHRFTLAESASSNDNVEHIYLKSLTAGRYCLEVSRPDRLNENWTYAVAWRVENQPPPKPSVE